MYENLFYKIHSQQRWQYFSYYTSLCLSRSVASYCKSFLCIFSFLYNIRWMMVGLLCVEVCCVRYRSQLIAAWRLERWMCIMSSSSVCLVIMVTSAQSLRTHPNTSGTPACEPPFSSFYEFQEYFYVIAIMKWLAGWKGQGSQMPGDRFHMIYMLAHVHF